MLSKWCCRHSTLYLTVLRVQPSCRHVSGPISGPMLLKNRMSSSSFRMRAVKYSFSLSHLSGRSVSIRYEQGGPPPCISPYGNSWHHKAPQTEHLRIARQLPMTTSVSVAEMIDSASHRAEMSAIDFSWLPNSVHLQFIIFSANVSVHRRRTLCAVRCDALFNAFIFPDFHACKSKISENRPKNRILGLVEPSNSIFGPFFAEIFGFRGIARSFFRIFSL